MLGSMDSPDLGLVVDAASGRDLFNETSECRVAEKVEGLFKRANCGSALPVALGPTIRFSPAP
jgi:hypothetical protein